MSANMLLLVVLIFSPTYLLHQIQQCQRGECVVVGDRETDWEFDQPKPLYMDADVERMLGGERRKEDIRNMEITLRKTASLVNIPRLIHMIWVGSSLPELYYRGPLSFASLNPEHQVHVWLDHPTQKDFQKMRNIHVRNITEEVFQTQDLIDKSTNMAMVSDIMRVELVLKYGGIYVDIDAVAKRPFGPIFDLPFICLRPVELDKSQDEARGLIYNHVFGMNKDSSFLTNLLKVLRDNFDHSTATIEKTGPHLWRKVLLQSKYSSHIQLIDWTFLMRPGHQAVVVDLPGDSVTNWWEMEEDTEESGPVYTIIKQMKNSRGILKI